MEINIFLILILVVVAMIIQSSKNKKVDSRFGSASNFLTEYEPRMTEEELKEYRYLMNIYIQVSSSPKHRALSYSQRKRAENELNASIRSLEIFKDKIKAKQNQ